MSSVLLLLAEKESSDDIHPAIEFFLKLKFFKNSCFCFENSKLSKMRNLQPTSARFCNSNKLCKKIKKWPPSSIRCCTRRLHCSLVSGTKLPLAVCYLLHRYFLPIPSTLSYHIQGNWMLVGKCSIDESTLWSSNLLFVVFCWDTGYGLRNKNQRLKQNELNADQVSSDLWAQCDKIEKSYLLRVILLYARLKKCRVTI